MKCLTDPPHSDVSHHNFYDILTFPAYILPIVWHQSEDEQASFSSFGAIPCTIVDVAKASVPAAFF